jgi:hypothetical protein
MKNLTGIYWIKDEARYIPEYVEFHLLQGFDHFIFYDNNSKDNLLEVISPYIEQGLVEIRKYPNNVTNRHNFWLMDHCNNEQKGKSKWVHYHALDERLFCPDGRKVTDLLTEYENYGGLAVAWIFFNSSGHETRPEGLITDNFTTALEDNMCHIKTIVQTKYVTTSVGTPHNFRYNSGKHTVDEKFNAVNDSFNSNHYSYDKIKLHHYVTMSKEEFEIKMNKGLLDVQGLENKRRPSAEKQWEDMHDPNHIFHENRDLQIYSETIKNNIKNRYIGREHLLQFINH